MHLGKELKRECELFQKKLDTSAMFKEWVEKTLNKSKLPSGKLFVVEKHQKDGKLSNRIKVNYPMDSIVITKEVTHHFFVFL
jgi:hypothetical protein